MKYSLIIPCYNESKNLPKLIEKCLPLLDEHSKVEVILVNNGSTDDSAIVLEEQLKNKPQSLKVVHLEKNKGYGDGILQGLKASRGEVIGWTHADLQTDPKDFLTGIEYFKDQEKLFVKGQRFGRSFSDTFFTIAMSIFESLLMRQKFWDINAQPTIFSREFYENYLIEAPSDFSLDLYVYFMANKHHYKIQRFPVLFSERFSGTSHWNINFKEKMKFIKRTIQFSFELKKSML